MRGHRARAPSPSGAFRAARCDALERRRARFANWRLGSRCSELNGLAESAYRLASAPCVNQAGRVDSPHEQHSWRDAAANADFVFYRPIRPAPDAVWAGGYGWGPGWAATHLGIQARIADREVSVDTSNDVQRVDTRLRVADELSRFVLEHPDPVGLPWRIDVSPETRTVLVDDIATDFAGVRVLGGTRWSGSAQVGDLHITITTEDPAVVTAIQRCDDRQLSEFEPPR